MIFNDSFELEDEVVVGENSPYSFSALTKSKYLVVYVLTGGPQLPDG